MSLIFGIVFGYLINFTTPPPDRPVEVVGKILANIGVAWMLIGTPLFFILCIEHSKKWYDAACYSLSDDGFIIVTPKNIRRTIPFEKIRIVAYPRMRGSKLQNLWGGRINYIRRNKIRGLGLDTKASFRFLIHYLKAVRRDEKLFRAIIERGGEPDDWSVFDVLKKSIKNPEVWDKYLEEYWATHNRSYWLNTPLEKILEDLHCPYTLEELENPSEDEYVEIDESKIREDVC